MRREYLDASFLYNCLQDKIDINILNYIELNEGLVETRANTDPAPRLKIQHPKKIKCSSFFNYRIIQYWNNIPSEIVTLKLSPSGCSTLFKKRLKTGCYLK